MIGRLMEIRVSNLQTKSVRAMACVKSVYMISDVTYFG